MLRTRILSAAVFAPAFLFVVVRGALFLDITILLLSMLMLWEFMRVTLPSRTLVQQAVAYTLLLAVVAAIYGWLPSFSWPLLLPAAVLLLFVAALAQPEPLAAANGRIGLFSLGIMYCAGTIPYLVLLRRLDEGVMLCLAALFCTWGSDTGAYFVGKAVGRTPLYRRISPNKTLEGALGGIATAVGIALLFRWFFDSTLALETVAILGLIAGIAGIIGDLSESLLKRSADVKDSSSLIPGHGGVLDRFDGVMFTAPAMYIYVIVMGAAS